MSDMNLVTMIGRLGADPEVKEVGAKKTKKATLNLAVQLDKETTEWHTVEAWAGTADILEKYAKKGARIGVTGILRSERWKDKEEKNHYRTYVSADRIQLL